MAEHLGRPGPRHRLAAAATAWAGATQWQAHSGSEGTGSGQSADKWIAEVKADVLPVAAMINKEMMIAFICW